MAWSISSACAAEYSQASSKSAAVRAGVGAKEIGIRAAKPAIIDEHPDGDAVSPDASIAPANVRVFGNSVGAGRHVESPCLCHHYIQQRATKQRTSSFT
jgi:hypothetical protein